MNEIEPKIKLVSGNTVKDDFRLMNNSDKSSNEVAVTSDRVSLSQNIKEKTPSKETKNGNGEIRHDLVNKFRSVLQDGTYSIKADEIADKLVQNIRDNKNRLIL
jgi:flagellar biosynthesis anti-sigma factor FlgM